MKKNNVIDTLKSGWLIITIITLVFVALGSVYSFVIAEDQYQAESIIALDTDADVDAYKNAIKSDEAIEELLVKTGYELTVEEVKELVDVVVEDSNQIKIVVTSNEPSLSSVIANDLLIELEDISDLENHDVVKYARVSTEPVSADATTNILISFIIGSVIGTGIVFLLAGRKQ